MDKDGNGNDTLESIIKVEAAEFQNTQNSREAADNILRFKANM